MKQEIDKIESTWESTSNDSGEIIALHLCIPFTEIVYTFTDNESELIQSVSRCSSFSITKNVSPNFCVIFFNYCCHCDSPAIGTDKKMYVLLLEKNSRTSNIVWTEFPINKNLGIFSGTRQYPLPTSIDLPNCDENNCKFVPGQDVELSVNFRSAITTYWLGVQISFLVNNEWLLYNTDINGCDNLVEKKCPLSSHEEVIYRNSTFQIPESTDVTEMRIRCAGNKFFPMWCATFPVSLESSKKVK